MSAYRGATARRAERRHVGRLEQGWALREDRKVNAHRRVASWQRRRRDAEQQMRASALAYRRWAMRRGMRPEEVASRMGLSQRTLSQWAAAWRAERLAALPRGRRMKRATLEARQRILGVLAYAGPGTSIPLLQELFPEVARRELEDFRARYRRAWRKRRTLLAHVLTWTRAGAVWAMDFAEPPLPVEGAYPRLLAVRDLGSGQALAALPVPQETGQIVRNALEGLFKEHGPPLVVKSDNGPDFVAQETREFLAWQGVHHLRSPIRMPSYNGACEAGIGSLKVRAHHHAARHGRPGEWTCEDVEAARREANETGRPRGLYGPTPEDLWNGRTPIATIERKAFAEMVDTMRAVASGHRMIELAQHRADAIEREAVSRALVACGILKLRRRRISLPIKLLTRARIS